MLALPAPVRVAAARRPVRTTVGLAALLVFGFVLLRLVFATSLGGFVVASDRFVDPTHTPDRLGVVTETGGYDGQFVYRLAVDPWTARLVEHGVRLDNPAYRQQRIATPVLAWTLALLSGLSTTLALVLVNAAALVIAACYGGRLAADAGRHPACGLVLAFPACMPISLGRDLTEPVAWAAVLAGLWYARRRSWPAAAAALTVAVLARETSLLVVAGLAAGALLRAARRTPAGSRLAASTARLAAPAAGLSAPAGLPAPAAGLPAPASRLPPPAEPGAAAAAAALPARTGGAGGGAALARQLGWLAVPIAVGVGWQLALWRVWGTLPLRSGGSGNIGELPLLGVLHSLVADLPGFTSPVIGNPLVGMVVFGERFAVLGLFCYAGVALLRRQARPSTGEALAWALSVALALSLTSWSTDVQFLRAANEAVGLSLLVAVGDDRPSGRLARSVGVALVAGVALMYAVRQ